MKRFCSVAIILAAFMFVFSGPARSQTPKQDNVPEPIYCTEIALKQIGKIHEDTTVFKLGVLCNNPTGYRVFLANRNTGLLVRDIYSVDTLEMLAVITFTVTDAEKIGSYVVIKKNPS